MLVLWNTLSSYRFGFVEFASVEEARAVFDKPENIMLGGRVIFIDYSIRAIAENPSEPHFTTCVHICVLTRVSLSISHCYKRDWFTD